MSAADCSGDIVINVGPDPPAKASSLLSLLDAPSAPSGEGSSRGSMLGMETPCSWSESGGSGQHVESEVGLVKTIL